MEMYLWYSCKFMQHGKDNQYNDDLKLFFYLQHGAYSKCYICLYLKLKLNTIILCKLFKFIYDIYVNVWGVSS